VSYVCIYVGASSHLCQDGLHDKVGQPFGRVWRSENILFRLSACVRADLPKVLLCLLSDVEALDWNLPLNDLIKQGCGVKRNRIAAALPVVFPTRVSMLSFIGNFVRSVSDGVSDDYQLANIRLCVKNVVEKSLNSFVALPTLGFNSFEEVDEVAGFIGKWRGFKDLFSPRTVVAVGCNLDLKAHTRSLLL
jgi:hypothetical protein